MSTRNAYRHFSRQLAAYVADILYSSALMSRVIAFHAAGVSEAEISIYRRQSACLSHRAAVCEIACRPHGRNREYQFTVIGRCKYPVEAGLFNRHADR